MRGFRALLIATVLVSVPASAQFTRFRPVPGRVPKFAPSLAGASGPSAAPSLGHVYADISAGARTGQLSHSQASFLRSQTGEIGTIETRYGVNGISDSEAAELQFRVEALQSLVDAERAGVVNSR